MDLIKLIDPLDHSNTENVYLAISYSTQGGETVLDILSDEKSDKLSFNFGKNRGTIVDVIKLHNEKIKELAESVGDIE